MNDFTALNRALEELTLEEGKLTRNRLVWTALKNSLDTEARKEAAQLSETIIEEQRFHGVHSPSCGELIAAEILFQVWLLMKGGNDGTD